MSLMTLFSLLAPPFLAAVVVTLILAIFGKSLGIRRFYVKVLLHVFEFAREIRIAHNEKRKKEAASRVFELGCDDQDSCSEDEVDFEPKDPNGDVGLPVKSAEIPAAKKQNVICRQDNLILEPTGSLAPESACPERLPDKIMQGRIVSMATFQREFELSDVFDYVKTGIASVIEDEVTQRFVAEELKSWNLLTRTSQSFEFVNKKLTVVWIIGFFVRYFILLPGRVCILLVGSLNLFLINTFISLIPFEFLKRFLYNLVALISFRIFARSISAVINFHNTEYRPKSDGICVANHTTPIDVVILSCDRSYALVGQSHGGALGLFQKILGRATSHVWFERSELKDRMTVYKRLKEHVEDDNKLPILIFPEGTCINNTSVMQFKKGSFEVGGTVYPVAIKYDPKFGDAFWNSSKNGMISYIYMMMTSWAIVCDVWYLPPMQLRPGEDAISFANRVKKEIARKGGLVDLMWDGNLKRQQVKSEWKATQQKEFSKRLKVE